MLTIALYEPQIPQNSGNIARTCAVTGTRLVLLGNLGFQIDAKQLKRAGLDYWHYLEWDHITDVDGWLNAHLEKITFFSAKQGQNYTCVEYQEDHILLFGSETSGFPQKWYQDHAQQMVTLPMLEGRRCINLSSAAAVGIYEALRQTSWKQLQT